MTGIVGLLPWGLWVLMGMGAAVALGQKTQSALRLWHP